MTVSVSAGPEPLYDRAVIDALTYCEARKTDEAMDAEIATAKNKPGTIAKYKSRIPPLAQSDTLPEMDESWGTYLVAAIAIGQLTWARLNKAAQTYGVTI